MKKNVFAFIAAIGLIGLFTACSSDDKDDKDEKLVVDEALLGQWDLSKQAITIKWDAKEGITNEEFVIHLPAIPALGMKDEEDLSIVIIPAMAPMLANPMLTGVLQNITFLEDGNITATYSENGEWKTSPKGLISYGVIAKNELISIKLNADNIIKEAGITDKEVIKALKKAFSDRIALKYTIENDSLSIYLDKDSLKDFLPRIKSILSGLNLDKDIMDMINGVLTQMPRVIEQTEVFKFGLNFEK